MDRKQKRSIPDLIREGYDLSVKDWVLMLLAVFVIAGILGFIYEELFYRIDLGHWVKRGDSFGPWISIYAVGGLLLSLTVHHFRKHPLVVFLLSCLVTGTIEYVAGWAILTFRGERVWDYNTEIWNWGNIDGFVCARSVLLFGLGGVALVYYFMPHIHKWFNGPNGKRWKRVMLVLAILFFIDLILYHSLTAAGIFAGWNIK